MAKIYEQNQPIFERGTIVPCTKMSVLTIGLGLGRDICDLIIERDGEDEEDYKVFQHIPGHILVATKEHPEGDSYADNLTVVVRVLDGRVLINGQYDLYCPGEDKIGKLLSNPVNLDQLLSKEQLDELEPLFLVASDIRPSLAPEDPCRMVICITDDMVGEAGTIKCQCPWDPDNVLTDLYPGDFFLVQDPETFKGYRIGKEEFELTHKLV